MTDHMAVAMKIAVGWCPEYRRGLAGDIAAALAAAEERGRPRCETIETAPKDGTRILLHPAVEVHDQWSKGHWSEDMRCWIVGGSPSGVEHTHWMTLPAPPAITKEPTP